MQSSRLDYMVGCLLNAVDQVVVPVAAQSNVAGVPGLRLRGGWVWPFSGKIFNRDFQKLSARPRTAVRVKHSCVYESYAVPPGDELPFRIGLGDPKVDRIRQVPNLRYCLRRNQ